MTELKPRGIHGDLVQGAMEQHLNEKRQFMSEQIADSTRGGFAATTGQVDNGLSMKTMAEPCASDLWFLTAVLPNILPDPDDERFENYTGIYEQEVKFIKILQSTDKLSGKEKLFQGYFEVPVHELPSDYRIELDTDHCAVVGFPIGPQCAIWGGWLIGEISLEVPAISNSGIVAEKFFRKGTKENELYLFSQHSVEKGTEIVNTPVFESVSGYSTLITKLEKASLFPVPGELLCLAINAAPGVAVFWQETTPVLFAGNWFSTQAYTSGTIATITEADSDIENDYVYDIVIEGYETVQVASSDFYEYQIGDRVTLLKNVTLETKSMDHTQVFDTRTSWQIVPMTFYGRDLQ